MTGDATIVTGRRVADRYRLVAERGDGSWDAVDETLKRNVVVCLLPGLADPDAKTHFAAEARALAGLNHRNVVATFDTGVDGDGSTYRVDELPSGRPLDPGAVSDDMRVSFATQIARALADAHSRDLVHGSLTSGNVLVNDEGRVKVRGLQLPDDAALEEMKRADIYAVTNLIAALAPAAASPLREMALGWRGTDPPSSVAAMASALLTIPDDSDTTPLVDPHPTPVTGIPTVGRRRQPVAIIVGVLVIAVVALVITALLPGRNDNGNLSGPSRALTVIAKSFDPEGDKTEHEAQAKLAVDGNAATNWATEPYKSDHFGNLKKGVGLILQADGPSEFSALHVRTPSRGWTYRIYVAEQPAAALVGWGEPIASGTASTDFTVDLGDAKGGALLVWITDPAGTQMRIAELDVTGRAVTDELVAQAQAGDKRALDTLLRDHYDRMYAVCRRLTGSDADAADACQEALIAVVRNIGKFDSRSRFGTWAYRIAVNASLDELRRRKRRPRPDDSTVQARTERANTDPDVGTSVVDRITLDAAMATLSPEFRAAVVLRDIAGLDYAEIAAALEIPAGTVRSRIARGRAALANHLGES